MKRLYYLLICITIGFTSYSQSADQNYIMTTVYKQPYTDVSNVPENEKATTITYFDGLGRAIQTIHHNQSATGKDIIQHIEYDNLGRQVKEYLPFTNGSSSLDYQAISGSDVAAFYDGSNGYPATTNPFSEKELEASPLNRVLKQAAPGNDWALGSGHEIKFKYQTNGVQEVKLFAFDVDYDLSTYKIFVPTNFHQNGYYAENTLYKNVTIDENNAVDGTNTTQEFKNKQGQVVLKRITTATENFDTYYVYDDYGNLTYVLPPKASAVNITSQVLNNLCYQYQYDYRNRMVAKKIPGKSWEYIVYDKLDRVRATGPVNAPFSDLQGQTGWLITKYDALDRPILTAWQHYTSINPSTRMNFESSINNTTGNRTLSEGRDNQNNTISGVTFSYTNTSYPTTNYHILTITYYDDYNYHNAPTPPAQVLNQNNIRDGQNGNCKGLVTGSWVRILEQSSATAHKLSYSFYKDDRMASPVQQVTTYPNGGYTQTKSEIDFEGKTLQTVTEHRLDNTQSVLSVEENFTYSDQGRLLTTTHKVNSDPEETIAVNSYKKLGELQNKAVGGSVGNPLQTVKYHYNIRGWLTGINDIDHLLDDLFAFKISYNQPENATALYNGNISETFWKTSSDNNKRKYSYLYDNLNRLTQANYKNVNTNVVNTYNVSLDYDKNGNIQSLVRNGGYESLTYTPTMDNLQYFYDTNSNLLKKVVDLTNNPNGFKDDSVGTVASDPENDYTYDQFGNMTKDQNKHITNIEYNHLNLPTAIHFDNNRNILFGYDANGVKMKKEVTSNTIDKLTLYMDGFQYLNKQANSVNNKTLLQFFPTSEGYVKPIYKATLGTVTAPKYQYVYNYTDHLGNIRLQYSKVQGVLKVLEETHYYPFGLKHGSYNQSRLKLVRKPSNDSKTTKMVSVDRSYKYKYNGKELQEEFGLDVYDYGARFYYPDVPFFWQIDQHSESYFSISPFSSFANNPISFIDPNGKDIIFWQWQGSYGEDGKGKWVQVSYNDLDKKSQQAIKDFASTKIGKNFLSNFANKGDKIGDIEFTKDGKYSNHTFSLYEFNSGASDFGSTGEPIQHNTTSPNSLNKNSSSFIEFYIKLNIARVEHNGRLGVTETIGHEIFLHLNQFLDDYIQAYETQGVLKQNSSEVYAKHSEGNPSGARDHLSQWYYTKKAKEYYRFISQLKSIFNPKEVQNHVNYERNKNFNQAKSLLKKTERIGF